jgi:hypothetical protein
MLDKLDALNRNLAKNGLMVTIDRDAAEALTDEDLAQAVRDVGHTLVEDTRKLRG